MANLHIYYHIMNQALISSLSIAPMIDWTYSHFRVLMRMLAPRALLYTEMLTPAAILHQPERSLAHHAMEYPLALQLGGSDSHALLKAALIAQEQGYQEINLNLGCPSDRVQSGHFGVCMMRKPELVAECMIALKSSLSVPVTAKMRIGIDHDDSFSYFADFAKVLIDSGADKLIVHARKAWLKGLSPKQNRTVPAINYDFVYTLKSLYSALPIVVNGNIQTLEAVLAQLEKVDGVMLGRLACDNPYAIAEIHHALFNEHPLLSRVATLSQYAEYACQQRALGINASLLIKPILNMAHGLPHARLWKEALLELARGGIFDGFAKSLDILRQIESECVLA